MHTYRIRKAGNKTLYAVGFESSNGNFHPMEDFDKEAKARELVNYLNGGNKQKQLIGPL